MDSPLIAVTGTLLGVLVGAWLTYRFSIALANDNAKRFAGIKLRESFGPEVAKLSHPEKLTALESSHILERAFEKHQIAVNEFGFFLKGEELETFNWAWREYYGGPADDRPNFTQYANVGSEDIKEALARIEAILAFTKR